MKEVWVNKLDVSGESSAQEMKSLLEQKVPLIPVDVINWSAFSYVPQVGLRIGHTGQTVCFTFYVKEAHVLARYLDPNSPTHKDSCVEFFIDIGGDGKYYNFEFNPIGTVHLAFGASRNQREFIEPSLIESDIKTFPSLGRKPIDRRQEGQEWSLTVIVPVDVFVHHEGLEFSGLRARANFYKCGDETETPHYLSWNPIDTDRPDFHQPSFFGRLIFE